MKLKNSQIEAAFICFREIGLQDYPVAMIPKIVNGKRAAKAALDEYAEKQKDRIEHYRALNEEEGADEAELTQKMLEELNAIAADETEVSLPVFNASDILVDGVRLKPNQIDFLDEIGVLKMEG